jgi:hypothetical protein
METSDNVEGEEITNVGSMNTMGDGAERPGRCLSQIRGICSL